MSREAKEAKKAGSQEIIREEETGGVDLAKREENFLEAWLRKKAEIEQNRVLRVEK